MLKSPISRRRLGNTENQNSKQESTEKESSLEKLPYNPLAKWEIMDDYGN